MVDDASTDNSAAIIEDFARRDPVVRLLRNKENMGPPGARKRALKSALGDYIFNAASDDKVLPGFFEKSMAMLAQHPEAGLCFSDPAWLDDSTGAVDATRLYLSSEPCYFPPGELVERLRRRLFMIAGHTVIMKRSLVVEAGGSELPWIHQGLRWHSDWFSCRVVAFRHGACYVPEPLSSWRMLQNTYGTSARKQPSQQREVLYQMMSLLKSPAYRDVLPLFERSNVLAGLIEWHVPTEKVRLLFGNPKHWDHFLPLAWVLLLRQMKSLVSQVTPLKRLRRRVLGSV